ncbi:Amidohydrolase [Maioricimonas rarisocia]|uniref:Amidohydrolase n=1 Tax=Maioricimonas rarisocia TaxID=2528026 RepID=A0A517Z4J1_9PLAN|nr:amidohydrolase family protein [Maioricimonas rarisocia]QDU37402.1 Amidohydrolase [Maioricimonas rarisocia]
MIDAHLHLVDFCQETEGLDAVLAAMDAAGIERAVVFGLAVTKEWSEWEKREPTYYLSDNCRCYYYSLTDAILAEQYLALGPKQQQRLAPLLCGFNPVDQHASRHVERILDLYPDVFHGIGEILCRHDDLTNQLLGQPPRANHPALRQIYSMADARNWPVLIHQDISSVGRHNEPLYLHEIVDPLQEHSGVTFVWAHCGHSRRINVEGHLDHLTRLMDEFDNLCLDYSWYVYDSLICEEGRPRKEWVEFTERFSDRICLGSDIFGRFDELESRMNRYSPLLEQLSDAARRDISDATAERLYFGGDTSTGSHRGTE